MINKNLIHDPDDIEDNNSLDFEYDNMQQTNNQVDDELAALNSARSMDFMNPDHDSGIV